MESHEKNNRIAEALSIRGMKAADLVEKTGLSKGSVSHWIKQHWQPKQKAVMLMARALDVSEMWLAGYDAPMEKPVERVKIDSLAQSFNVIRKDEQLSNIAINLPQLTEEQRTTIENMVLVMVKLNQQSAQAEE